MPDYLKTKIVDAKCSPPKNPYAGLTRDGYTKRAGAPTATMIRLEGEKRWRRVMAWQFSNAGTAFVRVKGKALIVNEYDIPKKCERK